MLLLGVATPPRPGVRAVSCASFHLPMAPPPVGGRAVGGRSVKIRARRGTVNSIFPHHVAALSVVSWPHSTTAAIATGLAANGTYANVRPFLAAAAVSATVNGSSVTA